MSELVPVTCDESRACSSATLTPISGSELDWSVILPEMVKFCADVVKAQKNRVHNNSSDRYFIFIVFCKFLLLFINSLKIFRLNIGEIFHDIGQLSQSDNFLLIIGFALHFQFFQD